MMKRYLSVLLILVSLMTITAACGAAADAEDSARIYLDESTTYMSGLAGYEFLLAHSGPSVFVDEAATTELLNASGHFVSPDRVDTTIKVSALGFVAEISVISIGEEQWGSNPLTGSYQVLDDSYTFKPTVLFDPEAGFFAVLKNDLTDLVLVGTEELEEMPGLQLQHLSGNLSGEVIVEVSYGLVVVDNIIVDIWVDSGSGEIHRVTLTEPLIAESEEESVWQIDFWSFGETIEIEMP